MARYSISELKNKITDRIHENHARRITGPDLQEILHDVIDSVSGAGGGISEIFHGWHGQEFAQSSTFYRYIGQYSLSGNAPTMILIRGKTIAGAGAAQIHLRIESESNLALGQGDLAFMEEYSWHLIELQPILIDEPVMIQYKSSQAFQLKELILL